MILCKICKTRESYSDSEMCKECCHNEYIESCLDGVIKNSETKSRSVSKSILENIYSNAFMNGRCSLADQISKDLKITFRRITKDSYQITEQGK